MWNSGLRIVWFKLHIETGKRIHLLFPISLNVLLELLDCILDLMTIICLFTPKTAKVGARMSMRSVRALVLMLMALFSSITDDGPYDLVDVGTKDVKVSIKIR